MKKDEVEEMPNPSGEGPCVLTLEEMIKQIEYHIPKDSMEEFDKDSWGQSSEDEPIFHEEATYFIYTDLCRFRIRIVLDNELPQGQLIVDGNSRKRPPGEDFDSIFHVYDGPVTQEGLFRAMAQMLVHHIEPLSEFVLEERRRQKRKEKEFMIKMEEIAKECPDCNKRTFFKNCDMEGNHIGSYCDSCGYKEGDV